MIVPSVQERHILAGVCLVVGFAVYAFFPWVTMTDQPLFNSPDETANFFFSEQWAEGQGLRAPEPLNEHAGRTIHPRSMAVAQDGSLVPASFVGLPVLIGSFAVILGEWTLPFVTALLTALALLAIYACWREYFDERQAMIATALAAIHPALWYFASRPFYHNVLFVDLIIFAWWAYERMRKQSHSLEWLVCAVVCLMAALYVRTSEVVWVLPVAVLLVYRERRLFTRRHAIAGAVTVVIVGGVYAVISAYGGGEAGYRLVDGADGQSWVSQWYHQLKAVALPFGLHPVAVLKNFFTYGVLLFWPVTVLTVIGLTTVRRTHRPYIIVAGLITIILAGYYGNATIVDSVGMDSATIGNSFVRYWLPIYLIWLPFTARGVRLLSLLTARLLSERIVVSVVVLVLSAWSFSIVYFDRVEGLTHVADRLAAYYQVRDQVERVTGENALIVSDQADKFFFPLRRVITPGDRPFHTYPETMRSLSVVADAVPTYAYIEGSPSEELRQAFQAAHLAFGKPIPLVNGARLYPVVRL